MDVLSKAEVDELRADFKSAMLKAREYMNSCEHVSCSCIFSKEEIEKYSIINYGNLVDLTKEQSYRLPSGLSREEIRKQILDIGSKLLTKNSEEEKL